MRSARSILACLLAVVLALTGCASKPIVYKNVPPPKSSRLLPVQKGEPVVALVLGGGASRGFAHVGVIKVLEEQGIRPDIIVGTSAGSLVGALYAGGYSALALQSIALGMAQSDIRDVTLPGRGFLKGEMLQDFVNQYLDNRSIEALPVRFAAVATDLQSGELMVFNRGNTGLAVRASSAIPGIFQPATIDGRDYVDGGLLSTVPVRVARRLQPDILIAVDVSRTPEARVEIKDTFDVLAQTLAIMGRAESLAEMREADIVIRPDVNEVGALDFAAKQLAIARGEQAARAELPRLHALLRGKARH
jgi:NTE family protein